VKSIKSPISPRVTEWGRFALLGSMVLELFIFPPLLEAGVLSSFVGSVIVSLTLVAGAFAVGTRTSFRWLGISVAALSLLAHWFNRLSPGTFSPTVDPALSLVALGTFTVLMLEYTLGKERLVSHRLVGAIISYLLLGVVWAMAYQLLLDAHPGAIHFPGGRFDSSTLIYFSFATLTTLGFGTPVHPVARSLAMCEALVGMLYPAVFIARLLSLRGRRDVASGE
jgi:hypothetical protein